MLGAVSLGCLVVRRLAGGLLRRLRPRRRRRAAARPAAVARARAGPAADPEVAAAGRRRARRRQPDSGAAPHVGERRRADAVARARRRVCRHGARQLRVDHRLDGHGAQSRSVRDAVAGHRDPHARGFRRRWAPSWRRCRRRARPDGARRPDRLPADAGHDRRDGGRRASRETAHRPPVEGDRRRRCTA